MLNCETHGKSEISSKASEGNGKCGTSYSEYQEKFHVFNFKNYIDSYKH